MSTFGDRLRQARERRKITLEQIAESTKIGKRYLEALERNDFDALPGGAFNKGYVRTYAQFIGVDPEPVLRDYLRQLGAGTEGPPQDTEVSAEAVQAVAEKLAATHYSQSKDAARKSTAVWSIVAIVVLLAGGTWAVIRFLGSTDGGDAGPVAASRAPGASAGTGETSMPAAAEAPTPPASVEPSADAPAEPAPSSAPAEPEVAVVTPPPVQPSVEREPEPAVLSVSDYGVGTAIENRQLVGQSDRFAVGTTVWFWTRVVGGQSGGTIRHVWLHEGRQIGQVDLKLGGPHWRTQSRKALLAGSAGAWVVEARDSGGRVLARSSFVCEDDRSQ